MPLGFLAGAAAVLTGAGIWAAVTVGTGYQIRWMAIGVGVLGRLNPQAAVQLMSATFSPIVLLFYGLAVYGGYMFSFRRLTDEDLARVLPGLRTKMAT